MVRQFASVHSVRPRVRTLILAIGIALVVSTFLAPERAFAASGWRESLGSIWQTLACILRPTSACGQPVEIGCGLDPSGLCIPAPSAIGCGTDPDGKCATPPQGIGCGLDPHGPCRL